MSNLFGQGEKTTAADNPQMRDFRKFSHKILRLSNTEWPKRDFFLKTGELLLKFSRCDVLNIWLLDGECCNRYNIFQSGDSDFELEATSYKLNHELEIIPESTDKSNLVNLCNEILSGRFDPGLPCFTSTGSFLTSASKDFLFFGIKVDDCDCKNKAAAALECDSLAIVRIEFGGRVIGLLQLQSEAKDFFTTDNLEIIEDTAQLLGEALINQHSQAKLRERVKGLFPRGGNLQ